MNITEKDLIGGLQEFPIEIAERMLWHQVDQGNTRDVTIFQNEIDASQSNKGFTWSATNKYGEGTPFWNIIINKRFFSEFFKKYPKVVKSIEPTEKKGDELSIGDLVKCTIKEGKTTERVYIAAVKNRIITVTKSKWKELQEKEDVKTHDFVLYKKFKKIPKKMLVWLSLEDISKGLGKGIDPTLLRIKGLHGQE